MLLKSLDIYVYKLDDNGAFDAIGEINQYTSLIWPDKFNGYSTFELNTPVTRENRNLIKEGNILWCGGDIACVIEIIQADTDNNGQKIFKVKGQKYYWLQHGVTKDRLNHKDMDYSVKEYSLVCCTSKKEVDFFKEEFGYNDKNVKLTGFCRFDGLENAFQKNNLILIMPTHRKWLNTNAVTSKPTEKEEKRFLESEFYKEYSSILTNNELLNMLKKNNTKIIFYIHYALQVYSYLFKKFENEYVIIAQSDLFDVQDLLRESKVLITDYSSVFFDFAYMKKPILYYQFDIDRYRESHYKEGYFSYKDDGFGEICLDKNSLQKKLVKIIKNNYQMEKRYIQRVDDFFDVIDKNNCERIYSYIKGEEN